MIARVEPLITARSVRGPFDYRVSERLGHVEVGSLLLVPFGPQRVLGVVVEMADTSRLEPERLAEPIRALELGTPPELVRLATWMAHEYCTTPARALELVLPPGTRRRGRQPRARSSRVARATGAGLEAIRSGTRLGPRQREALAALSAGEVPVSELSVGRSTVESLVERGLVELERRAVERRPPDSAVGAPAREVPLNPAQAFAVSEVVGAIEAQDARELLLHGVTGSGKTEVYLAAAAATLERGRGAIVLVPEIALTAQTMSRFKARFGDRVALLHSRLSEGERRDEWVRLRRGEARIAVGPRSAVFAPVRELGLVIVDEEHEPSYKQESDPRYDARQVARRRAESGGAAILMGSATPRPESWISAERLELHDRADGASMPRVEVLDMRGRPAGAGPIHPVAAEALASLERERGKAIVLLNRRGWSPHLSCSECGTAWRCPECDVSLVVHLSAGRLRCHHCGHEEPEPSSCGQCGSVSISRGGVGTEQLERTIAGLAGGVEVIRLDADSTTRRGELERKLARFGAAGPAVLIGTQMVAKGHDFPDVTLAVVVDADATLRFPDFRSEERTFSLVTQLAGRSGRAAREGRVLVQTLAPEASAITLAARHDSAGFMAQELERRRELAYPPFSNLIAVEARSAEEATAHRAAVALAEAASERLPAGARLAGPAPRFRLRGEHRRRLLVKATDRGAAIVAVRAAVEACVRAGATRGSKLFVDVDPQ